MRDVLIDLGEVRPRVSGFAAAVEVARPVPYRMVLVSLSIVLVVLLGGGAHAEPQRPPVIIPAVLGDATVLAGDRLFVVGTGRQTSRTDLQIRVVSSYAMPEARLIGRTTVTVSGAVVGVTQAGGTVLVEYQDSQAIPAVVAQTAGGDQALWRRTARLVGASAADGIALLSDDRGDLAVDLATGAVRWSMPRPADGFIAAAGDDGGFPRWLVLVTDAGLIETRDAHTGRVIATATLPAVEGRANGMLWPVGDLILVNNGPAGFDGYRLPGLTRLWHTPADLSRSWTQAGCGTLVCTFRTQNEMTALDQATGHELWHSGRWAYARASGSYLLGEGVAGQARLWVIDPATGEPLGDFGRWEGLGPAGDGLVYGTLDVGGYEIWYGVLDPATRRVRILGSGERVSGDCRTGAGVLLCRLVDASIAVWRLG